MTHSPPPLVLITGPSGAGLSTATDALEDIGFEAIDNLPLRMIRPLLNEPGLGGPLSISLHSRTRGYSARAVLELLSELEARTDRVVQLLYLDCSASQILQRFSSTRRPHPRSEADGLMANILAEIEVLQEIRSRAHVLIDTTELNPHELRDELQRWFGQSHDRTVVVQLQSFSYKRGLPRGADIVLDCRFLRNPHWQSELRASDGRSPEIQSYVRGDPRYQDFFQRVLELSLLLLPAARQEGKSYLTIAFGCSGGKHRSVTLVETLGEALAEEGWQVSLRHRELERARWEGAPQR